ncbi:MAG: hypothetical protein C0434_07870 [Xanthomonadaceae bacterium]|nr:hypothetical protein [Xanthomonadaceae bacterium]
MKRLGAEIGLTTNQINAIARNLNCYESRWKRRTFKPAELLIIEQLAGRSAADIKRVLKREGFERSIHSIIRRRYDLGLDPREERKANNIMNTVDVGEALCVSPSTVSRWIDREQLTSKRASPVEGTKGALRYEIRPADLRAFLARNPEAINLKTVPQDRFLSALLGDLA